MNSIINFIIREYRKILYFLLGLDFLLLLSHIFFGPENYFFHLDHEQNLPTVYQSGKLIVFGLIYLVWSLGRSVVLKTKKFIIPLSIFLVALGFDELLQIHENIYRVFENFKPLHPSQVVEITYNSGYRSSLWMIYYLPLIIIFVAWCLYWVYRFWRKLKAAVWTLIISGLCVLTVIVTELLSSTGEYSENTYFWLITVEEMAEMILASTLIFLGAKVIGGKASILTPR